MRMRLPKLLALVVFAFVVLLMTAEFGPAVVGGLTR